MSNSDEFALAIILLFGLPIAVLVGTATITILYTFISNTAPWALALDAVMLAGMGWAVRTL